jgi:hypothetical protein
MSTWVWGIIIVAALALLAYIAFYQTSIKPFKNNKEWLADSQGSMLANYTPYNRQLRCGSPEALNEAKKYYDQMGMYHGLFTIDPVSSYQVDDHNCDIKYQYYPTEINDAREHGVDSRRFTYAPTAGGKWKVALMGDWKSGVLNM